MIFSNHPDTKETERGIPMSEQHLKSLAAEYQFPYNHLYKILNVELTPPFTLQYKEGRLRFLGFLPSFIPSKMEEGYLRCMGLNLGFESTLSFNIGQTADEKLTLNGDIFYNLDYKMLKEYIETFANHLDTLTSMIQEANLENA